MQDYMEELLEQPESWDEDEFEVGYLLDEVTEV